MKRLRRGREEIVLQRAKYDEGFFIKYCREVMLDFKLPFKLQKRQLLKKLKFPLDDNVLVLLQDCEEFNKAFSSFMGQPPFLVGIHLRPMLTNVTPFFLVDKNEIRYCNEFGSVESVSQVEMFDEIGKFASRSGWIELVKSIWGHHTIVGRLVYSSFVEQLLEIQRGVTPKQLGNDRLNFPYLYVNLCYFDTRMYRKSSEESDISLCCPGIRQTEVNSIISSLKKQRRKFEVLARIADLPTLEFGYVANKGLVVIDVDWPKQYQINHQMA